MGTHLSRPDTYAGSANNLISGSADRSALCAKTTSDSRQLPHSYSSHTHAAAPAVVSPRHASCPRDTPSANPPTCRPQAAFQSCKRILFGPARSTTGYTSSSGTPAAVIERVGIRVRWCRLVGRIVGRWRQVEAAETSAGRQAPGAPPGLGRSTTQIGYAHPWCP